MEGMVSIYREGDLLEAFRQKRKESFVLWGITLLYLAFLVAMLIVYCGLPYKAPEQTPIRIAVSVVTVAYIAWIFPYAGIRYSRVKHYCAMMNNIAMGITERHESIFDRIEKKDTYDYVDVYTIIVKEWNSKKMDYAERRIYSVVEKPMPPFIKGDRIEYITAGSLLLQYRIARKEESVK